MGGEEAEMDACVGIALEGKKICPHSLLDLPPPPPPPPSTVG